MAITEHFDGYFTDFGVDATVGGVSVRGIFDDAYADPLGIGGSSPVLLLAATAAPLAAQGDAVVVGSASYTIGAVEPDGTGMTRLRLVEA